MRVTNMYMVTLAQAGEREEPIERRAAVARDLVGPGRLEAVRQPDGVDRGAAREGRETINDGTGEALQGGPNDERHAMVRCRRCRSSSRKRSRSPLKARARPSDSDARADAAQQVTGLFQPRSPPSTRRTSDGTYLLSGTAVTRRRSTRQVTIKVTPHHVSVDANGTSPARSRQRVDAGTTAST